MGRVVHSAAIAENDDQEPLLSSPEAECSHREEEKKKKSVLAIWVKPVLEILIWVVFISWTILIFLFPMEWFSSWYSSWTKLGGGTLFGNSGRVLLIWSCPIVIVTLLAIARQIILDSQGEEGIQFGKRRSNKPTYKLGTFPVLVDGVFGVVSAAELIGIIIVTIYIIWSLVLCSIKYIGIDESFLLIEFGISFAYIGSFAFVLLFLAVARGSAVLRLINVPFDHAVKYHIWLGNITLLFFTLHGISFTLFYAKFGDIKEIFSWNSDSVAILPGVIAVLFGWVMWITSIHPIRRKYFESFYYTHHLYILFVIFFALHVGDFYFSIVAGAIFIFMMDRFLRFCQSRTIVDVVSTKYLSCGVVELALAKSANLRYNALSFIFLQIREVSWLQWHPFSISSTLLDGEDRLSLMIKVQGQWTRKLKDKILSILNNSGGSQTNQHCKLTASVEGPYHYELPYYLTYTDLVLVAGGVGISPFLAILKDIVCRIRDGKPCPPKNILLVWAVRKSNELSLISEINTESLGPSFSGKLINVETRVYVTRELGPPPSEESVPNNHNVRDSTFGSATRPISTLVGTGNSKWLAIYSVACTIGFVIVRALVDIFFVIPMGDGDWWLKGLLLLACMVGAVAVFGGPVLGLWRLRETTRVVSDECENGSDRPQPQPQPQEGHVFIGNDNNTSIEYGSRPNLRLIFESVNETRGLVDVGVIVCGPSTLESSVAEQCRYLNLRRKSKAYQPIFHFHTHSFSL